MRKRAHTILLSTMACILAATASPAADDLEVKFDKMELKVEVPRLKVSEYHRPYVAMWIQDPKGGVVVDLAVWYQSKGPDKEVGTKWLPDLRQWWRRSGRKLEARVDAISGPTPPPGEHTLKPTREQLAKLSPGKYTLLVEAAREVGGREMLEVPFTWPGEAGEEAETYEAQGKTELGKITLTVKP